MKRFFERIGQKALDATQPPVLMVAFGDSVTQGGMEYNVLNSGAVYHRLLQEELEAYFPQTTFSTINAGVGRSDASQALARLDRDVIQHHPDLVLVSFGLNDSLGGLGNLAHFGDTIEEIIGCIRQKTDADIMLLTPSFMATQRTERIHANHQDFAFKIIQTQIDGILAAYAQRIRELAHIHDVGVADIHAGWSRLSAAGFDTNRWLINGLNHPDARGHRFAAKVIFQALLGHFQNNTP